ncbi:MAG: hypothetical protein KDN22_32970 [Verrucomicrobiae bacterium]|nr:hypothetical protein [Verrucomicrobiae bacterium]
MEFSKIVVLLLVTLQSVGAELENAGTWVAIVPPGLAESLAPLARYRSEQGWDVRIQKREELGSGEELPAGIHDYLHGMIADPSLAKPVVAVLAGVPLVAEGEAGEAVVPGIEGDFLRMKGVAADSMYSLLDGKRVATLSGGRLPARNAGELAAMIEKIRNFESEDGAPRWKTRLSIVAASSGGGPIADAFVAQQIDFWLKEIPSRWTMQQVADLKGSLFSVPPGDLRAKTKTILEGGQLFNCYIGHASPDSISSSGGAFFTRKDFSDLNITSGAGVFLTCGCETLAHDVPGHDGHGYSAMRAVGGPAAFIGAEHCSNAAIGLLAFDGLAKILTQDASGNPTLADCWQAIFGGIESGDIDPTIFTLMDQFDGSGNTVSLADQRKEHLQMWMLLGDPAMKIPMITEKIGLEVESAEVEPGGKFIVRGSLPDGWGDAKITVTAERTMASKPSQGQQAEVNDFVLAMTTVEAKGRFELALELPGDIPWEAILVRAIAESEGRAAQETISIPVAEPKATSP